MDAPEIQPLTADHWPAVSAILEDGIAMGDATFETAAPGWAAWDRDHLPGHRLVAAVDGQVVGWAALSPVSERCVYAGVAEDSVYVAAAATGRGVGRALLERLVAGADAAGIWTVQAGTWSWSSGAARWWTEAAQPEGVRGREARARSARRNTSSTSPEALTRRTRPV